MRIFKIFLIIFFITHIAIAQNSIILKISPEYKKYCKKELIELSSYQDIFKKYRIRPVQLFPNAYFPEDTNYVFYKECVDISTIYELTVDSSNVEKIISELKSLSTTEYCHRKHYPEMLYTPNDPAISAQYYLEKIKAYEAWDIFKGDSTIIIGIVDTGIELAHDDLWQNIAYNYADPIDGFDNDGDGFIDNFHGWDLGNNDNNPEWNEGTLNPDAHGVFVAGMAAPTTNNGVGIAGVAFKTKFLPIKITDSLGYLSKSYEGIVYAADHGCKIINCSWGGTIPDNFGYDIIKYATYNRKCLVIAAAGNNGNTYNSIYYPAAYDEVVAVAATNQWDYKWVKSCYGLHIDICAPGENVYSTYENNGYTMGWGTSYASPLTAGVAALCLGYRGKNLLPFQIRSIIENSADVIDTIPQNLPYEGQLGKGRVNALRALTDTIYKAVRFYNYTSQTNYDTTYLFGKIVNLFSKTQSLWVKLTTTSSYIHFIRDSIYIGHLDSLAIFDLSTLPFIFTYTSNAPFDMDVVFRIQFNDINYSDFQTISITVNQSYTNISNSQLDLTVCANGRVGYNKFSPIQGKGINYKNQPIISDMGFFVFNNDKGSWSFSLTYHFNPIQRAQVSYDSCATIATSVFNDSLNYTPMNLTITNKVALFEHPLLNEMILLEYNIYNSSSNNYDSLYAGILSDVDLLNYKRNSVRFDSLLKVMYVYPTNIDNIHTGFYLPDTVNKIFYAFDNDGSNGSINLYNGLTLNTLQNIIVQQRFTAGIPEGNDVSIFVGYGPFSLLSSQNISFRFIMPFGVNKYNFFNNTFNIKRFFDANIHVSENDLDHKLIIYPNPFKDKIFIASTLTDLEVEVITINGQKIFTKKMKEGGLIIDLSKDSHRCYIIRCYNKDYVKNFKVIKMQ